MEYEVGRRYPQKGEKVFVVEKKNYDSGILTLGVVKDVLTKKTFHPRGHKVRLENGIIGRVQKFATEEKNNENQFSSYKYTLGEDDLA